MKLFIDTANIEEIRKASELGIVKGVTTNPSLIAKEGRKLEDVIKEIDNRAQSKKLYENIKTRLDDREREVIKMRYGLHDGNERTQSEIAEIMGISRSYVSRIEKRAIGKLKFGICDENMFQTK